MLWTEYLRTLESGRPAHRSQMAKYLRIMTKRQPNFALDSDEQELVDAWINDIESKIQVGRMLFVPELVAPLVNWVSQLPTQPYHR